MIEPVQRRVFYSFHYAEDATRAARIRNIGRIEGNRPATDNAWEQITKGGDPAIQRWIDSQMHGRSCCVVLIGEQTANRPWINYEIRKAWNDRMGLLGIHIHNLKKLTPPLRTLLGGPVGGLDLFGQQARKGLNPFDYVSVPLQRKSPVLGLLARPKGGTILGGLSPAPLTSVVKVYDPPSGESKDVYGFIALMLSTWLEEAIKIRQQYG